MSDSNPPSFSVDDGEKRINAPDVTHARAAQASDSTRLLTAALDSSLSRPSSPPFLSASPPAAGATTRASTDQACLADSPLEGTAVSSSCPATQRAVARRGLTIPMLHLIASFFPSTVLPPDLRHIHEVAAAAATAAAAASASASPHRTVAGPALTTPTRPPHAEQTADELAASPLARQDSPGTPHRFLPRSPSTPLPLPSLATAATSRVFPYLHGGSGSPASVVQKALEEERPPISLPLAFIAANPQCRRARELHSCVLPPQGGLVLRLLGPAFLFPTAEAQLAHAGEGTPATATAMATGGALPASLYYTKRGHWLYDARSTDGGTAAAERRQHARDRHLGASASSSAHTSAASPASPAAVLLVVSRNVTLTALHNTNTNTTTTTTSPTSRLATAAPAVTIGASPTVRSSPGLLPVYGARLASSPTSFADKAAPFSLGPPAVVGTATTTKDTATTLPTSSITASAVGGSLLPVPGGTTESMEALARAAWWLHRTPALPLSLSLQSYSAEQTLAMMARLADQPSTTDPAMMDAAAASDSEENNCGHEEADAEGEAARVDAGPRRLPVVWSAHSLHTRSLSENIDAVDGADAAPRSVLTTRVRAHAPPTRATPAAFRGVTEFTLRSAGGGGGGTTGPERQTDPRPSVEGPRTGTAPVTDSKALTLLLAQYPELRSLSLHNANVTGDDLDDVSRACQHVTHLSLGMNPTLHTTRFLAPSVASTTTTQLPPPHDHSRSAADPATTPTPDPEEEEGEARVFPHILSASSLPSTSRGLSFSLDQSEAAALRDALLSPRERRQLALVVRPADVRMGGLRHGVGNLQGEEAESRAATAALTTSGGRTPHHHHHSYREQHEDGTSDEGLADRDASEAVSPALRPVHRVDADALLREMTRTPAADRVREAVLVRMLEETETATENAAMTTSDGPRHYDPALSALSTVSAHTPPPPPPRLRRGPRSQPAWATTLLELDLSFTAVHTDDVARYVPRLRQLHVLWLEGCRDITSLAWLPALPCLQELNLARCDGLQPASLWPLRACECLERLSLSRLAMMKSVAWLWAPPLPVPAEAAEMDAVEEGRANNVAMPAVAPPPPPPHPQAAHPAAVPAEVAQFGAERFLRQTVDGGVTAFTLLPRATTPPPPPPPHLTTTHANTTHTTTTAAVADASTVAAPLTRVLAHLDLSFTGLTREGLAPVRALPNLTSLSLHGCRALADVNVNAQARRADVPALPPLLRGDGPGTSVEARTIGDALVPLEWLGAVDLSGTGVREATLTALVPRLSTTLHTLHLAGCRDLTRPPAWLHEKARVHVPSHTAAVAADLFMHTGGPTNLGLFMLDMPDCTALGPDAFADGCLFTSRLLRPAQAVRPARAPAAVAEDGEREEEEVAGSAQTDGESHSPSGDHSSAQSPTDTYDANSVSVVRLRGCDRVCNVAGLAPLCWVTELDLYHTAVTSASLVPALQTWQCLHTLVLASTGVTDFSAWLPETANRRTSGSSTGLSQSSVGPGPARALPRFVQTLQHLDLSNTTITSDGVGFIAHCPQLTTLWMRRCRHVTHLHFLPLATAEGKGEGEGDSHSRGDDRDGRAPDHKTADCGIVPVVQRTALRELVLTDAVALASTALADVAVSAGRLRKLILSNCSPPTSTAGAELDTRPLQTLVRTTLQELDVSGSVPHAHQVCALLGLPSPSTLRTPPPSTTSPALMASLSPTKPTTPARGTPSPRRLSLDAASAGSPMRSLLDVPAVSPLPPPALTPTTAPVPCPAHVGALGSGALTTSTTVAGTASALQTLRLRGCRQLSAEMTAALAVPALRMNGFPHLEKVYL